MRLVIVESPYAGDAETIERNVRYARAACADCLDRGEAPWASHLLYTQPGILRDEVPAERKIGIAAGLAWGAVAELSVVYLDLGVSRGMEEGIRHAVREGRRIDLRLLSFVQLRRALGERAGELVWRSPTKAQAHAQAWAIFKDEQKAVA
jgi:hypothetical protein